MKNSKKEQYVTKKNPDGTEVYCPHTSGNDGAADIADTRDDCVEKDVVERYSGNIDIR
jgi:hypothetical protein